MKPGLIFLILFLLSIVVFLAILIPVCVVHSKRKKFVLQHSNAIKQLDDINKQYTFKTVDLLTLTNSYDNENNYNNISTRDYLTYKLVSIKEQVMKNIKNAEQNKILYADYKHDIDERCKFGDFGPENLPTDKDKLIKIEKKCFKDKLRAPLTVYFIDVNLRLTNINGVYQTSKSHRFNSSEILKYISGVNNKSGDYYRDKDIWDAICRVERGKVSNKMRFAIYNRDGHRCRKCGRYNKDLEIDHIVPISKGGKSTYDNLQTLCRRCNLEKGTNTERYGNKSRRFFD